MHKSGYPCPNTWDDVSPRQANRASRSFKLLRKKAVPVFHGRLVVEDDDEVTIQTIEDVVRRSQVLLAVVSRADGMDQADSLALIEQLDAWPGVSPSEKVFLLDDSPSQNKCIDFYRRTESIWTLFWALNLTDRLAWPSSRCNIKKLLQTAILIMGETPCIEQMQLRSVAEILDAKDLHLRIHWAIRDASMRDWMLPFNLNWTGKSRRVPLTVCKGFHVVQQRH